MAQLSRPYQIALAVTVFLALAWFVALRGHSASTATPVASAPAPATAAKAKAPAGRTHIEGMTRAVTHAREAVAASQRAANKSAAASAEAPSQGTSSSSTTVVTKQGAARASDKVVAKHVVHVTATPHKVAAGGIPAQQAAVESELKQGKVVAVLFWNPKGADDVKVRKELQAVGKKLGGKLAVHTAEAKQVGAYGSITQAIQVYQTPTILFVNGKGLTTTLTGFTDAFSIEQTIDEARQA